MSFLTGCQIKTFSDSVVMSATKLTPKQLEIRQRGSRILDCAFPMVCEGGLAALSMEAIAKAMNCTRGTIYNHFPNKEDVLLALATRAVQRRMRLFHYGTTLGRNSRESCAAIGIAAEVYADLMPDDFAIEQVTRHDPLWQKTSPQRRNILRRSEHLCISGVGGTIEAAIEQGDLPVPQGTNKRELIERLVFGLWSLVYGGLVLEATGRAMDTEDHPDFEPSPENELTITAPRLAIRRNCNALLDDAGWQPLYSPKQYNASVRRIRAQLIEHAETIRNATDAADEAEATS